jgi:tripartite-type tricarboxylate transporter receptor subunit TctC
MTNKADATRRGHREAAMRDATNRRVMRVYWLLAAFGIALCGPAHAQGDYPNRAVRIVVPATPGGGSDTFARLVAQHLAAVFGQQFVVDNRPGGGTLVGMDAVLNAPHDGHTLYLSPSTTTSMHVARKTMPYDVRRVFTPVTQLVVVPHALIVNPSVPAKTTAEFIALAKRGPGKLTYGSAGIGTAPHMAMELFKSMTGIDVRHIPYRGVSQSVTDILGERVSGMVLNVLTAKPHLEAGKLRALGVTGLTRSEALPDIATIAETVPKYQALQWFGILAPAGTPAPVVNLLQAKIAEGLRAPEMKARLAADGAEAVVTTPAEFTALINEEIEKWTALAKAANIQPED